MTTALLPWAPLEEHVHRWYAGRGADRSTSNVATALGIARETVSRYREQGALPIDKADKLAARFGAHPCEVWGDDYFGKPWYFNPAWPSTDPEFLAVWAAIDPEPMRELRRTAYLYSCSLRGDLCRG